MSDGLTSLRSVSYRLAGGTFSGSQPAGCVLASSTVLACTDPAAGPATFRIVPDVPAPLRR